MLVKSLHGDEASTSILFHVSEADNFIVPSSNEVIETYTTILKDSEPAIATLMTYCIFWCTRDVPSGRIYTYFHDFGTRNGVDFPNFGMKTIFIFVILGCVLLVPISKTVALEESESVFD